MYSSEMKQVRDIISGTDDVLVVSKTEWEELNAKLDAALLTIVEYENKVARLECTQPKSQCI